MLPPQRYITVVAQDPSVTTDDDKILMAKIAIPAEKLVEGPIGYRIQVIDYDATAREYYGSHAIPNSYDEEPARWQRGDPALVNDFAFHAQNVYALVMKTLSWFEHALGRRLGWSFRTHQLKIAPHGMLDANAFYSPQEEGLVFGYFQGRSDKPVYTCLSHDIVVHETTHALVDALRDHYLDPSHPDQAAFHEGFSDVIALLSVFSLPEVVSHLLAPNAGGLLDAKALTPEALQKSALFALADEMGSEISGIRGDALRRSAALPANKKLLATDEFQECHRRGEVFVAAVMRAFIHAWSARVIGSGVDGQQKFPAARVADEGAAIAEALATMWIRALDYMPPVHLEFGDALSAALTADREVRPDDTRFELRTHLTREFAAYGIVPASDEDDGIWRKPPEGLDYDRVRFESMRTDKDEVFRFLWENREKLELRQGPYTEVLSVRPCTRIGPDGFVVRETIAEYYQVARLTPAELREVKIKAPRSYLRALSTAGKKRKRSVDSNGEEIEAEDEPVSATTPLYGGGVLVFDEFGRLKYHVHNDVYGRRQSDRLTYLWEAGMLEPGPDRARYKAARLSTLHMLRALDLRRYPQEGW